MSDFPKYTGYSDSLTVSYGTGSNTPQYRPLGYWCFKSNSPRLDAGCLHCDWSMKIGASWLCFYPRKGGGRMITDELRERIAAMCKVSGLDGERLYAIADRIDAAHEDAIKKLSADFEGQLYCESFVNWAVMDKFAVKQRDLDERVSVLERKLNHRGDR